MILVLEIIIVWTAASFGIGIPFWMYLTRRNRIERRETERWLQGHPDMSIIRRVA